LKNIILKLCRVVECGGSAEMDEVVDTVQYTGHDAGISFWRVSVTLRRGGLRGGKLREVIAVLLLGHLLYVGSLGSAALSAWILSFMAWRMGISHGVHQRTTLGYDS
jgi:hypothetical protein